MDSILQRIVAPLASELYGNPSHGSGTGGMDEAEAEAEAEAEVEAEADVEVFADSLDHHHSFVVAYAKEGGDQGLDMHHDASEVTLNVCLGKTFVGGGLTFCGRFGSPEHRTRHCVAAHAVGTAIMHLGRQRHGANDIDAGERLNLILWARSSAFRSAAAFGHVPPDGYPKQPERGSGPTGEGPPEPDRQCLSRANDVDYNEQVLNWEIRNGLRTQPQPQDAQRRSDLPECAACKTLAPEAEPKAKKGKRFIAF